MSCIDIHILSIFASFNIIIYQNKISTKTVCLTYVGVASTKLSRKTTTVSPKVQKIAKITFSVYNQKKPIIICCDIGYVYYFIQNGKTYPVDVLTDIDNGIV